MAEHVDLAAIQAFLTLAEELHFGRTAERLALSQPRVSQLIRSLERQVGGPLFERTSRRVSLTALGERLRERAGPAYADLRGAVIEVRRLTQSLRVGFLGSFSDTLGPAVARLLDLHPEWPVELSEISWSDLFGPLRRGEVDLQITLGPVEQPDLVVGPVVAEFPRVLAIARTHPLAGRASVSLEDLAGLPVVQPHPEVPAELKATFWPPPNTPGGRPIPPGPVAATHHEMLRHVAGGQCCFVTCTALAQHYTHPGVLFLPFDGLPPSQAVLCWRATAETERIHELVRLAR